MKGACKKLAWGLVFSWFFVMKSVWAQLPVSFISTSSVAKLPAGQQQVLNYTIRNNVKTQFLPITIAIVNGGDRQASDAVTQTNTCGAVLPPNATCSITVTIRGLKPGPLLRYLSIDYQGRAPLISPLIDNVGIANTTILVYMVGSDLETDDGAADFNINQMQQVGSTATMNVVLETGGSKQVGWETVKRELVQKGKLLVLQDLGADVNMANASVIQEFVSWGISNFPAQKYILVFWDHGGGPNGGFGGDQNFNMAKTPINQLIPAVQNALTATGARLELIGFDTCLLGNAELASGLAPLANYLVGSEDIEPSAGWRYNTFLSFVNSNLNATGLAIGTEIVNGYTEQNSGKTTTLSVTDLSQMANLVQAVNQFSTLLTTYASSNTTNWKKIAQSRFRSADYNTSVWISSGTDVVDLIGLAANIQNAFISDTALFNAAEAVIISAQAAIKYFQNSPNRSASLGLTTYFPSIMGSYVANYGSNVSVNNVPFYSQSYINLLNAYNTFYQNNTDALSASFSNFVFNAPNYTATLSNDYAELYAGVGSQTCAIIDENSTFNLPCIAAMQFSGISTTSGGGSTWNVSYDANAYANQWPLINGVPGLLIDSDVSPSVQAEQAYIIPVTAISTTGNKSGFLQLINNNGVYSVVGFLPSNFTSTSTNSVSKVTPITDGSEFYLEAYAKSNAVSQCYQNSPVGTWCLMTTSTIVTAPLTVTVSSLPATTFFNQFAFLAGDLTGALEITGTLLPYSIT